MEKYFAWTVNELKKELSRRGASLKGKKKDLLEKLHWYDNNNNFVVPNIIDNRNDNESSEPIFISPDAGNYRDINANTIMPQLTKEHITLFLERFSVKKDLGKQMYDNQYLLCARIATIDNWTFIRGYCQAQMKKHVQYVVDIRLSSDGFIDETHCECAVGSGVTAHCKHVAVLLWGIEHMVREKKIICQKACTQELQSFHKPKKAYFGTPIKAEYLPRKTKKNGTDEYTALDPTCLDAKAYNERVRNLCINFCASHRTTMPIMHQYEPANLYAAIWDHWYTAIDPEEQLLQELNLIEITDDVINEIERDIRGQGDNKKWHEYRRHRITASNFHTCCIMRTAEQQKTVARRIINPTPFKSKATVHGQLNEAVAIAACESLGVTIDKCGLFISKIQPYLGASPDGLIGDDTIVEVKCPFTQRNSVIDDNTIPFLYRDAKKGLQLLNNHPYFYQVQGQLLVTGRSMAKLVVFTYVQVAVIDVPRDDDAITEIKNRLSFFYDNYFKPALFEEYVYKDSRTIFHK